MILSRSHGIGLIVGFASARFSAQLQSLGATERLNDLAGSSAFLSLTVQE
jgi:hypothetical protein